MYEEVYDEGSFYSILVRLKGQIPARLLTLRDTFLFHTGSIKRRFFITDTTNAVDVSIPYWFD